MIRNDRHEFYRKTTLDNGLRIVSSRMNHVHSASISFLFGSGSRHETDEQAGIAHFIEHMLFKGTERRPDPVMITMEIEEVGGMINAATGRESTNYWAKVPAAHLERAFDVLADIVRNSTFPEDEIEKERFVVIEEIRGVNDTPDDLVHDLVDELVWCGQAVGRSILGSELTIGNVSRDDMLAFLRQRYTPDQLVIAAAGRVDHDRLVELAERAFGDMAPGHEGDGPPAKVCNNGPRVQIVDRMTEQAHLCIGHPAIPYTDPRRYAQAMIDSVLSSGMSSRLFQEIRERRGLVYAVYGYFRQYNDVGQGVIYAGTDLERVDETISAIVNELRKLRDDIVSADELHRNKELCKGRIVMGLEDSRAVASWIGGQELTFGEIKTPREVMDLIDQVRAEDMLDLARELYCTEHLNLVLIGPYQNEDRFKPLLAM
ncbi:MAG TPA: pitrilysin family protein [Thermomicrobiales bacterium]|nr:pitrilysin family protein [Thermomicrobiales bacterium]